MTLAKKDIFCYLLYCFLLFVLFHSSSSSVDNVSLPPSLTVALTNKGVHTSYTTRSIITLERTTMRVMGLLRQPLSEEENSVGSGWRGGGGLGGGGGPSW